MSVFVPQGRNFVSLSISESYTDWAKGPTGPGCTESMIPCGKNSGTVSIPELGYTSNFSQNDSAPVPWIDLISSSQECVGGACGQCAADEFAAIFICGWSPDPDCVAKAVAAYNACMATAVGDYDTQQYHSRAYWKLVPISDDGAQNPIQAISPRSGPMSHFALQQNGTNLTLNATSTGTGPYQATVALSGDVGFTLTQTDPSFRPHDARDTAANQCKQPSDCHQTYTLNFDPPVSQFSQPGAPWSGSCLLTLEHPAYQKSWLPGSSTNYTLPNTDPNAPDYVFEQSKNGSLAAPSSDGLSIATQPFDFNNWWGNGQPVTVTSQDYGGQANLRATCSFFNPPATVEATIIDPVTKNYIRPQSGCSAAMRSAGNYATIPVDEDCNGIADSWEGQYTNPPGGHLDPTADNEPGYDGTTVGDGYSVHDEYRGFHYIQDTVDTADQNNPTGVVQWTSTDPVNTQDVFFWDSAVGPALGPVTGPCNTPGTNYFSGFPMTLQPNCITTALRTMLAPEMVNAQGQQFMTFRRVNAVQANAASLPSAIDPSQGVQSLNKNSATRAAAVPSVLSLGGFALVYGSNPDQIKGASDCGTTFSLNGYYAWGNGFANDGTSFMNIALPQIFACAVIAQDYPQNTFLAVTVAHETGHRLGLFHTYRPVIYLGPYAGSYANLTWQNYMDAPGALYLRIAISPVSGLLNPPYQELDVFQYGRFPAPYFDCSDSQPSDPANPGTQPWILSGCSATVPGTAKRGPVPAPGSCLARYATRANPTPEAVIPGLPFLEVATSGSLVGATRGRYSGGIDLMGVQPLFNSARFGTTYGFDPVCELPYLNPTPVPQQPN